MEAGKRGGVCGLSGQKHESVAGALGKTMKSREGLVRSVDQNCVGQTVSSGERAAGVAEDDGRLRVVNVQFGLGYDLMLRAFGSAIMARMA